MILTMNLHFHCSNSMETLLLGIEHVGEQILGFLLQQSSLQTTHEIEDREYGLPICYLHRHSGVTTEDQSVNSLRYDVIRMLIRGSEFPHALCLHLCNGAEEFHVYSKKGWISFHPDRDSLVITIGDKLQVKGFSSFDSLFVTVMYHIILILDLTSERECWTIQACYRETNLQRC
jgi:hypothetical protein